MELQIPKSLPFHFGSMPMLRLQMTMVGRLSNSKSTQFYQFCMKSLDDCGAYSQSLSEKKKKKIQVLMMETCESLIICLGTVHK